MGTYNYKAVNGLSFLLLGVGTRQKNNRLKAVNGARSRNRTGTAGLGPTDFKSVVSTYFTTRAFVKGGGGGADFNRPI